MPGQIRNRKNAWSSQAGTRKKLENLGNSKEIYVASSRDCQTESPGQDIKGRWGESGP